MSPKLSQMDKNCQLQKFLRILFRLQKGLFEISTTLIQKVGNCKF